MQQIPGIFSFMVKKILHILFVLVVQLFLVVTNGQQPSIYEVKKLSMNSEIFSEISPVIIKDGILFCSNRRFSAIKDRTSFDGDRLYSIYMAAKKDSTEWGKPEELNSPRTSFFNIGPMCLAPDGKTVYFTSEVETGKVATRKNFKNHNGIFIAELAGNDLTSVKPFKYNSQEYEVAHPSVSRDGKYLFFASDIPGGQGGSDLYYCEFKNGEWSEPVNMGSGVNSPGVENYPYIHPSGKLYFTTNRSGGFGNLDVYSTSFYMGRWEEPVLLPEPINSSSDDFAFVAEESLQTGYFSSNRGRTDDIYNFVSTIIRKANCNVQEENSFCFRFIEENAAKFDTMPFRYEWQFGDGASATGIVVEHCYSSPGTYLIQLDAVNLITKEVMYNVKTDTLILTEIEQPYITSPDSINTGQSIKLNSDRSNLPGWNIVSTYWNFGDETVAIGKEVDKTYFRPGTYNIQLIVTTANEPGGEAREACISKNIIVSPKP